MVCALNELLFSQGKTILKENWRCGGDLEMLQKHNKAKGSPLRTQSPGGSGGNWGGNMARVAPEWSGHVQEELCWCFVAKGPQCMTLS